MVNVFQSVFLPIYFENLKTKFPESTRAKQLAMGGLDAKAVIEVETLLLESAFESALKAWQDKALACVADNVFDRECDKMAKKYKVSIITHKDRYTDAYNIRACDYGKEDGLGILNQHDIDAVKLVVRVDSMLQEYRNKNKISKQS